MLKKFTSKLEGIKLEPTRAAIARVFNLLKSLKQLNIYRRKTYMIEAVEAVETLLNSISSTDDILYQHILVIYTNNLSLLLTMLESEDVSKYLDRISEDATTAFKILKSERESAILQYSRTGSFQGFNYKHVYEEIRKRCCKFVAQVYRQALLIS